MPTVPKNLGQDLGHYYIRLNSLQNTWDEGLLILMYHAIEAPPLRHRLRYLCVGPRKLRAQVRELLDSDARFIPAAEVNRTADRERRVLITLDDGFQSILRNGLPVFRELGVPAIAYIVAGQLGGSNVWDRNKGLKERRLMSRAEILEWVGAGYEIGAHTLTHRRLTDLSPAEARREIFDSKKILEDLIGRPVPDFCYPYGTWNEAVRDLVREAGYETACTVDPGYNFPETNRFTLGRFTARYRFPYVAAWTGALGSFPPGTKDQST
jgi:peptidoglycan/xylan/chitin deacetylase (PgdA/CDA1 family)